MTPLPQPGPGRSHHPRQFLPVPVLRALERCRCEEEVLDPASDQMVRAAEDVQRLDMRYDRSKADPYDEAWGLDRDGGD